MALNLIIFHNLNQKRIICQTNINLSCTYNNKTKNTFYIQLTPSFNQKITFFI